MKSSRQTSGSPTASRAQLFAIRQRYAVHGEDIEQAMLADLVKFESQYLTFKSENDALRKQSVKLNGLVARYETKIKKSESERQKFSRMAASLKTQLANEHARAEKFKLAYDNLRDHPVVRAARGLKTPFSKKPAAANSAAAIIPQKEPTPIAPDTTSVSGSEVAEPSIQQLAKLEVEKYRDLGQITEPADALRLLLAEPEAPKNFGPLHLQVMGQERLLKALPSVPPKTSSPAYVPQTDKVMYCAHSTGEFNSNGYSTRTTGLTKAVIDAGMDLFIAARPGYPWDSKVTKKAPSQKRLIRDYQGVKTHL